MEAVAVVAEFDIVFGGGRCQGTSLRGGERPKEAMRRMRSMRARVEDGAMDLC